MHLSLVHQERVSIILTLHLYLSMEQTSESKSEQEKLYLYVITPALCLTRRLEICIKLLNSP